MFWSRSNRIGRNEVCTCGSGIKFKNCCYILPESKRTHANVVLREKNMELIAIAADIFGLSRGTEWNDLRTLISDDQIREFYSEFARIWPINQVNIFSSLPAPTTKLRGLYMGDMQPQKILNNILRYSLYTDEVIVVNPLHHPHSMRANYSPIHSPSQYKQDTLEVLYFLLSLSPWISQGIVSLIPNPIDFDYKLRDEIWRSAEKRYDDKPFDLTPEENREIEEEGKENLLRMTTRLTPEQQANKFREFKPDATDDEISSYIRYLNQELENHSLWLKQPFPEDGELIVKRMGANLEAGLMLGQATGSYLYTNRRSQWNEILSSQQVSADAEIWSPLTKSFQQLDFQFLNKVDPKFVYRIQEEGRLSNLRSYLRRMWNGLNAKTTESQILEFSDELHEEHAKACEEWKDIDRELRGSILSKDGLANAFWGSVAGGTAGLLSGSLDWKLPLAGFCLPAVNALLTSHSTRTKFRNTVPLSVFIDLDNKGKNFER